jgi:hypothetical protein
MHHIGNIAPIPADLNRRKLNHALDEIVDASDRAKLEQYEEVATGRFGDFSATGHVKELCVYRGGAIKTDFLEGRRAIILGE